MGKVLALVERDGWHGRYGTVRRSACVLLTVARRLGEPIAVLPGDPDAAAVRTLRRYGATRICCFGGAAQAQAELAAALAGPATSRTAGPAAHAGRDATNSTADEADILVHLAHRVSPTAILIASGYRGQEIAARVAVRLDSGIITDAIDIRPGPNGPIATQSCLQGSYLVESEAVRGIPVITIRPEAAIPEPAAEEAEEPEAAEPEIESISAVSSPHRRPHLASATPKPKPRNPTLEEADIVVAGGRGLGSPEAFQTLAAIAEALGGAVAGSHTATELGWVPREARVGLTGKTVHPRLYLASGVSGSVRHRAGMQGAKTVVAIGDDAAAPIFRIADLGVVGDAREVLPALLDEIRKRKEQGNT